MKSHIVNAVAAAGLVLAPAAMKFADSRAATSNAPESQVQCIRSQHAPVYRTFTDDTTDESLPQGTAVDVTGRRDAWRQISYTDEGTSKSRKGWVSARSLGDCASQGTQTSPSSPPSASTEGASGGDVEEPQCGVERWAVKVGSDAEAAHVPMTARATTVRELVALARPPSPLPPDSRANDTERTTWRVTGTITGYKRENDSDYHIVISDGQQTMIAEIPDPGCMRDSPWEQKAAHARRAFDAHFGTPGSRFVHTKEPATIVGVGFFDFLHGQKGVAPNGIELHPVIGICFGEGCSVE